jgi:hypothetical protein
MTPAILREALFRAGNRVPLDAFLHGRRPAEVEALRESMAALVDWGLAIDHGDAWQAVRGSGKPVATSTRIKIERQGQRPLGVLPKMSERCQAGGQRNGQIQHAALGARIDALVERLRMGVPAHLLKGLDQQTLWRWRKLHPEAYARLADALEAGKARQVVA